MTENKAGFELEPEHSMGGLLRELLIGHFEMLRKILQPRAVDSSQGASVTRQSSSAPQSSLPSGGASVAILDGSGQRLP